MRIGEVFELWRLSQGVKRRVANLVRNAEDQTSGVVLSKIQHYIRGEEIGSILFASKDRDLQHVEHGMPKLMKYDVDSGANDCIAWLYA